MKFSAVIEKARELAAKIGTKTLIAICASVVVGGVLLLCILITPKD